MLTKETRSDTASGGGRSSITATFKVPVLAKLAGGAGGNVSSSQNTSKEFETLPADLGDVGSVVKILSRSFRGRYIVIEEFHYLPEATQRMFAFKLKTFHEVSDYVFIVVGVWLDDNRLATLNPDLSGRIAAVNADLWSREELSEVGRQGERILNVRFPRGFVEQVANLAAGSVYITRESCYVACQRAGIYCTMDVNTLIEKELSVPQIVREVVHQLADYNSYVMKLAGKAGLLEEQFADISKWATHFLLTYSYGEMRDGIPIRKLRATFRKCHPTHMVPTEGQTRKALQQIYALQAKHGLQSIIDFDAKDGVVKYADKGFILWRKGVRKTDIENMIFEPLLL